MEIGLRLGRALNSFWIKHGHLSEGRQWLEQILESEGISTTTKPDVIQLRAELVRGAGTIAYLQLDYAQARLWYEEAWQSGRKLAIRKRDFESTWDKGSTGQLDEFVQLKSFGF